MPAEAANGKAALDPMSLVWRTSSYSSFQGGECVEVAPTPTVVAVRDSKDRSGPVLAFAAAEWTAFLSGVRAGEFDL